MAEIIRDKTGRILFTKEMKKEYTILCPMMLPIHFELLVSIFRHYGYKAAAAGPPTISTCSGRPCARRALPMCR